MRQYQPRVIDAVLEQRLQVRGAVLLEGPKACGKTSTGERLAKSMVRMDVDSEARQAAAIDPALVLVGERPRLIDEWQEFGRIWDHVRREVDNTQEPGQFILAGSAVPPPDVRMHSGAGRIATLRMRPMSLYEAGASSGEVSLTSLFDGDGCRATGGEAQLLDILELLVLGGWPAQLGQPDTQFATDYLDQVARVDINRVPGDDGTIPAGKRDPQRVGRLIRSIARNTSTSAGERKLAEEADLSRDSVRDYIAALTSLMLIEPLPAFNTHLRSSRNLRSSAKWHFTDPSLATAALGADALSLQSDMNTAGLLFESLVIRDLRILSQPLGGTVSHFQTDHHEIDAIIQLAKGRWAGVEVKLGGDKPIEQGAANLLAAAKSIDPGKAGEPVFLAVVVAKGQYAYVRDDGVHVIPISTLAP